MNWLINDLIVKNLANNRRFQMFAVRLDENITKNKQMIKDTVESKVGKEKLSDPVGFFKTFAADVRKEMQQLTKEQQSLTQQKTQSRS